MTSMRRQHTEKDFMADKNASTAQMRMRFRRRDWLRAGCAGMIGLPAVFENLVHAGPVAGPDPAATRRAKSVVLILLTGGASQHDTFDLKPDAPEGIRGEFRPIDTTVPG